MKSNNQQPSPQNFVERNLSRIIAISAISVFFGYMIYSLPPEISIPTVFLGGIVIGVAYLLATD